MRRDHSFISQRKASFNSPSTLAFKSLSYSPLTSSSKVMQPFFIAIKSKANQFGVKQACLLFTNSFRNTTGIIFAFLKKDHSFSRHIYLFPFLRKKKRNVGFLRYYTFNQIPNFVLASPIILLSIAGIIHFITKIRKFPFDKKNEFIIIHVLHWLFLSFIAIFMMHIQVMTRFFASLPIFYWFCSQFFLTSNQRRTQFFILSYFGSFTLLGTILFTNFYPWT